MPITVSTSTARGDCAGFFTLAFCTRLFNGETFGIRLPLLIAQLALLVLVNRPAGVIRV
jgi:hypothetical protein